MFEFTSLFSSNLHNMSTASSPSSMQNFSFLEKEICPYLQNSVWRNTYLTEDTFANLVALTVINSLALILNILLNVLVIVAVATRRPLRTNSNILLACLAGSDLLAGLIGHPVNIAIELKRILGAGPFCTLEKVSPVILTEVSFASLNHLLLIGIDRYVAIKHPLRYRDIVTKQKVKAGVIFAWVFTAVLTIHESVLASIESETVTFSQYINAVSIIQALLGFVYISAIGYTYVYIFIVSGSQKRRLQTEQQLSPEEANRVKKNNKAANTLAFILAALILSYLPTITLLLTSSSHHTVEARVIPVLWSWSTTFVVLGSIFNPVIYCWRNKKLRRAFLEIFHFRQPENRPPEIEMVEIQRHQPEIQPSTCEAFSIPVVQGEPVLMSVRHLNDQETKYFVSRESITLNAQKFKVLPTRVERYTEL